MISDSPYSVVEQALVNAFESDSDVDLQGDGELRREDMTAWGSDRTVRGSVLRELLLAHARRRVAEPSARPPDVRGLRVVGTTDLAGLVLSGFAARDCYFETFRASATVFGGSVSLDGSLFGQETDFTKAHFKGEASFIATEFLGPDTRFDGSLFDDRAIFSGAYFVGADWSTTNASCLVSFAHASFQKVAYFDSCCFDTGQFFAAVFHDSANFTNSAFSGTANFREVRFGAGAYFGASFCLDALDFSSARFEGADPGPWTGSMVVLSDAIFERRSRVPILAHRLEMRRAQVRAGVHLLVRAPIIDLTETEFEQPSIVAELPSGYIQWPLGWRGRRPRYEGDKRPEGGGNLEWDRFMLTAVPVFGQWFTGPSSLESLRGATVKQLNVSGMRLDNCRFAGSVGLDQLTIDTSCSFMVAPDWQSNLRRGVLWRHTPRKVLREELDWRVRERHGWVSDRSVDPTDEGQRAPGALEVAGIYRALRIGAEDKGDSPGGGEFYYGESEMRRLAGARSPWSLARKSGESDAQTSISDRLVLHMYWAASGYGLRAVRGAAVVAVLLCLGALTFASPRFAQLPEKPPVLVAVDRNSGSFTYSTEESSRNATMSQATLFTVREALAVTRLPGPPILLTQGFGTVMSFVLRLATPILLALVILSVRGRTKRR